MNYKIISLPMLAILALAVGNVQAHAAERKYKANGPTSSAITGDISIDDNGIKFANGKTLAFSSRTTGDFSWGGEHVDASIYKVKTPSDPKLKGGNILCGKKVTYVATWIAETSLALAVFTDDKAPTGDDTMCALYTYNK
ncbi:hypothetical protein AB4Y96_13325 [Phyllobacterium sp. TAF24]|uniref:hypothetical protein n=1 Tax=Phyllobacterium sp. TAF24 TaxID=3233068 RepID=UPI003F9833BD